MNSRLVFNAYILNAFNINFTQYDALELISMLLFGNLKKIRKVKKSLQKKNYTCAYFLSFELFNFAQENLSILSFYRKTFKSRKSFLIVRVDLLSIIIDSNDQ